MWGMQSCTASGCFEASQILSLLSLSALCVSRCTFWICVHRVGVWAAYRCFPEQIGVSPVLLCVLSHSAPTIKASHPAAPLNYTPGAFKKKPFKSGFCASQGQLVVLLVAFGRDGEDYSGVHKPGVRCRSGLSLHSSPQFLPLIPRCDSRNQSGFVVCTVLNIVRGFLMPGGGCGAEGK